MRKSARTILWIASLSWLAAVPAQLPVPQVQLPPVRLPNLPVEPALRGIGGSLQELTGARARRANELFRQHRAELDRDPRGDLVVRAEVIAIDITAAALANALQVDFLVKRTQELADLGVKITVLQTPAGMSAGRGLKRLRKLDPDGSYDFNHVYLDGGESGAPSPGRATREPAPPFSGPGRVGLIDGGIDVHHEAFRDIRVQHFGCGGASVPSTHGTAVAFLLVNRNAVGEIFSADVYCGSPAGGAVDAVAAAFGWLARERVAVINVSLVGPRNALLERVVKTLVARGHLIVAAVGNDGPAAPPLYPAAYEGVIGVTAVDKNHRVLIEACRGGHVDFAAQGADVGAATQAPNSYAPVRGTSFAAPVIATLLTLDLQKPDVAESQRVLMKWSGFAEDLGKPGRDDVYGAGELRDERAAILEEAH